MVGKRTQKARGSRRRATADVCLSHHIGIPLVRRECHGEPDLSTSEYKELMIFPDRIPFGDAQGRRRRRCKAAIHGRSPSSTGNEPHGDEVALEGYGGQSAYCDGARCGHSNYATKAMGAIAASRAHEYGGAHQVCGQPFNGVEWSLFAWYRRRAHTRSDHTSMVA